MTEEAMRTIDINSGERAVIHGPAEIEIHIEPVEEPEPEPEKLWLKAPFKALSDDGFLRFAKNDLDMNGLNFWSPWSLPSIDGSEAVLRTDLHIIQGTPVGCEVFSHSVTNWTLEGYIGQIHHLKSGGVNIQWLFLDHESPYGWTDESRAWAARLRQEFSGIKIYSGPVGWGPRGPNYNPDVDGLYSFYNVGYDNRMPEDMAYILAGANYVKAKAAEGEREYPSVLQRPDDYPVYIGVQPVDGYSHKPVDPEVYKTALHIAAHNPDGMIMWSADRLWGGYKENFGTPEIAPYEDIAAAFKAQGEETGRIGYMVPMCDREGKPRPWFVQKAACRLVWHLGESPVLYDAKGRDCDTHDMYEDWPTSYPRLLILLENHDDRERAGYVGTEGAKQLKAEIREMETEMAGRL